MYCQTATRAYCTHLTYRSRRLLQQPSAVICRSEQRSTLPLSWYGYDFRVGGKIVHSGITQDPKRREGEHQQRWPSGKMEVVRRDMTEAQARAWEATKQKTITPERK